MQSLLWPEVPGLFTSNFGVAAYSPAYGRQDIEVSNRHYASEDTCCAISSCVSSLCKNVGSDYILPIRPINFQYPAFQAGEREKSPTPDSAGWSPAPLTRVSTDAGCPLRRPA